MFEEFMGTKPVSERQKFDTGALQDYMRQHVDGFSGELAVEQFRSSPAQRRDQPGQRHL